ncbi:DUF2392 domain containing protein [Trichuris trichiura]|uniref:Cytoplasmic tRNA 2-thiolation protein 2 n=1 Tax=Trichuris trichiura TaxID=36087 RepID=A0A077YW87_TRITR|nr:DUF2392 domain containing protein [Trichuris trichiura]
MHRYNDVAETSNVRKKLCVKCRSSSASVVLQQKESYCVSCFQKKSSHKFRSAMGREKLFRVESPVLVEVSGSAASVSLVNMVLVAADMKERKRLKMRPVFVHILFSSEQFDPNSLSALVTYVQRTGYPCYVVDAASIFAPHIKEHICSFSGETPKCSYAQQFQDLCNSCTSGTVLNELTYRLKMALLYRLACCLKLDFVLLDSTSTVLSAAVLSSVAQGRGPQIADEVAMIDRRWVGVTFLRPLREFTNEEVALFNYFFHERQITFPVYPQRLLTPLRAASIQVASSEFVEHLQTEFSSTVTTLIASASKFQSTNNNLAGDLVSCSLCSSNTNAELLKDINTFEGRFCYGCAGIIEQVDAKELMASIVAIMVKQKDSSKDLHVNCLPAYANK